MSIKEKRKQIKDICNFMFGFKIYNLDEYYNETLYPNNYDEFKQKTKLEYINIDDIEYLGDIVNDNFLTGKSKNNVETKLRIVVKYFEQIIREGWNDRDEGYLNTLLELTPPAVHNKILSSLCKNSEYYSNNKYLECNGRSNFTPKEKLDLLVDIFKGDLDENYQKDDQNKPYKAYTLSELKEIAKLYCYDPEYKYKRRYENCKGKGNKNKSELIKLIREIEEINLSLPSMNIYQLVDLIEELQIDINLDGKDREELIDILEEIYSGLIDGELSNVN